MVSYSNSIVSFSLILVLLILCNKVGGFTIVFEVDFASDDNGNQFAFDCIL